MRRIPPIFREFAAIGDVSPSDNRPECVFRKSRYRNERVDFGTSVVESGMVPLICFKTVAEDELLAELLRRRVKVRVIIKPRRITFVRASIASGLCVLRCGKNSTI